MAKGLGADERYWEALGEGRLELPRCVKCTRWRWPAPFRCGDCGSTEMDWITLEPAGKIYSWTRAWHRFGGTESFPVPYVAVLVELPEAGGIRLLGRLDEAADDPQIGQLVTGRMVPTKAFGRDIPAWRWGSRS